MRFVIGSPTWIPTITNVVSHFEHLVTVYKKNLASPRGRYMRALIFRHHQIQSVDFPFLHGRWTSHHMNVLLDCENFTLSIQPPRWTTVYIASKSNTFVINSQWFLSPFEHFLQNHQRPKDIETKRVQWTQFPVWQWQ